MEWSSIKLEKYKIPLINLSVIEQTTIWIKLRTCDYLYEYDLWNVTLYCLPSK
jgi:expansin (peptidoglycan-binding protein)